jgi:adenylate cyclase
MQTLELLDGEYIYEEGTDAAKNDPILQSYNIHTFLIVPQFYEDPHVKLNALFVYVKVS